MKHLLTILVSLMLISICEGQKTSSSNNFLHVIDLNKNAPEIKLSEVFENITVVALETKKESLIGMISQVVVTDEYLIVSDTHIAQALFLFKRDGTFLRKFGRKGGGPEEYSIISWFCYDNTTGTIYLLDNLINKIHLYNIHTGSFLKTIKLRERQHLATIYFQDGELYATLSLGIYEEAKEKYLLNKINQSTGEVEGFWFDIETWTDIKTYQNNLRNKGGQGKFIFSDRNSFRFHAPLMDGIMSVEKGKITPFFAFTPEYTIGSKEVKDLKNYDKNRNNKVGIGNYFECKDLIFMDFWLKEKQKTILYNQKTKDFKYVNEFDDLFSKGSSARSYYTYRRYIAHDDNGLFVYLHEQRANELKRLLENDLISDNFKNTAKELLKLEKDANPVLFYYKFKK